MRAVVERYGTALAGLALIVFFLVFAPNFAAPANLINVVKDTCVLALLALGFGFALTAGELDLSFADVASFAAVMAGFLVQAGHGAAAGAAGAVTAGLALGLVNGAVVTRLNVPSLIATLGLAAVARGLAFWITQGVGFTGRWPTAFTGLARGTTLGVPNLALWLIGATTFAWVLLKWTKAGAHLAATGEAGEAARLAGVDTPRMRRLGLALSGAFAGLAALLLAANLSSAAPNMAGDFFLYAVAAVLLGMTMFEPGRPNVPGTVFAAFTLKALGNGMVLMGAPYYAQDVALGVIIVASVAVSGTILRKAAFRV
ncbi:MAG: ABC transporter permease [Rhizobiales bacterium]|nr:ABC transporter permease [Hyphomicrobiales bacterium]